MGFGVDGLCVVGVVEVAGERVVLARQIVPFQIREAIKTTLRYNGKHCFDKF